MKDFSDHNICRVTSRIQTFMVYIATPTVRETENYNRSEIENLKIGSGRQKCKHYNIGRWH